MKEKLNLAKTTFVILFGIIICGLFIQKTKAAVITTVPDGYKAIRTIEDLVNINNDPSGKYILMNDIDLTEATKKGGNYDTGHGWTPLDKFSGVLDGNGFYIKGMHIYGNKLKYVGLFGKLDYAYICNLGIKESDIDVIVNDKDNYNGDYGFIGALSGFITDGTNINNCFVDGKIKVICKNGESYVGSIAGSDGFYIGNSKISKCYSSISFATENCNEYAIANATQSECYFMGKSDDKNIYFDGVKNFYLSGSIQSNVKAKELTQGQMRSKSSYTNWDFDKIWYIDTYSNYPYPQLRKVPQIRISGMEMVTMPNKFTYTQGEDISLEGATFRIIYNDGYTVTVRADENFKLEYNNLKLGKQDVKVSYLDGSITFPVVFTGIEVSDIELTSSGTNIACGNSITFKANTLPEEALDKKLTWEVTNANGDAISKEDAYITEEGVFCGNKLGRYIITVRANNGISKSYTVNVTKPISYLKFENEELKVTCGESFKLELKQSPLDSIEDIYWKSSDENIATVKDGVINTIFPGEVTITAETQSGIKAVCHVSVIEENNSEISDIEMVTMPIKTTYLQGEEISLEGAIFKIIYNDGSTNTVIADENFKLEYNNLKLGKQDVKVSYLDYSMTFPVVFTGIEVSDIELTSVTTNVICGNCLLLEAKVLPKDALDNKLIWSVTNINGEAVSKEIAYVTDDGIFWGYKKGVYIITARTTNGISKSCTVTVTNPIVYLIPEPEELDINCGATAEIKLKQSPLDSTEDIFWYSSDENIATVENGVVTALRPGKVTITAETKSGVKAECYVRTIQDISLFDVTGLIKQTYTGKEVILKNLKVYGEMGLLRLGTDYIVRYEDNVNIGTATVHIVGCGSYSGSITKTFKIVRGGLEKAKISYKSISLKAKKTKKLKISGAVGYKVKWSSQSKKIATVDKNGKVTAKKTGKTYIIAKVGTKTFRCKVVVRK